MPEPTKDATGDTLQSAASRLAEFVAKLAEADEGKLPGEWVVGWETKIAVAEARAACAEWTGLRRQDA